MRVLSSAVGHNYYILLALADEPLHGLGIQKRIIGDTLGFYVRDSSLYTSLKVLEREGLIEKAPGPPHRVTYKLTEKGRRTLEYESRTLRRAVELAQQRLS
jgi:DNA-binding PadR family transcriptional regulator